MNLLIANRSKFYFITILFWVCIQVFNRCEKSIDVVYHVTDQAKSATPVSELLYSHFIEVGFGYQIAPMQAERFFNRSFEKFTPYTGASKNSFGFLLTDGKYITDWSGEAWYHNGYEHNAWFAAPGEANNPAIITDESSFFICESPLTDVLITLVKGGCGHGEQSVCIINREKQKWGGIAQEGIYLEFGKSYLFEGYLKSVSGNKSVELRIYPEGNWDNILFSKRIRIGDEYKKYEFEIPYSGSTSQNTVALFIAPGSIVAADAFSLMPGDNFFGWKRATVEVVKKLNPGLIRFPGGCFASFYDWKKGVGEKDRRVPEPSYFWGGQNSNDLGTDEFAMLCHEVGAEMMLCVNLFHPDKINYLDSTRFRNHHSYALPQFADPERGVQEAVDWVAYCNLQAGEHPMADWRVENGYKEPFGVTYWEMDNESIRWFSAIEYAEEVVKYSKAMKAVDPTIKIGMITYYYDDKIPEMLAIAGKHVDFFADRDDEEEGRLDWLLGLLDKYNCENGTNIKYCNTEWQVHLYGAKNPKEEVDERFLYGHKTEIKRAMVLGTWFCGLKAAGYLMEWQRRGDVVDFVNYNNFSNTHGQAVIETPKEGAYLTAPGKLYELISRTPARWPLQIENYQAHRDDKFQIQASYSINMDTLVIYTLNRMDTAKVVEFEYSSLDKKFSKMFFSMLDADDIFARNKIDMPNEIRRRDWKEHNHKNRATITCLPRSFIQVVITE